MIHSGILYQLDILYILFLWAIIVSDFLPLEIYKNLVFPLSSITFTTNSQADNHFYNYLLVSNIIQYEISFLLKWTIIFFIYVFRFDLDLKHPFLAIKPMVYRKNSL